MISAPHCDALLTQCPHPDREGAIGTIIRDASDEAGGLAHVELGFTACSPECPDSATFVGSVAQAAKSGVRSVNVYNYGMLPLGRLAWIKQASRYARRETD